MASFTPAYERTAGVEGGYSDLTTDRGGETFKGISRRRWPNWIGWGIVDSYKARGDIEGALENHHLSDHVRVFYQFNFWRPIHGDEIPDQDIANEVYDSGVNTGVQTASRWLQAALNCLNRSGTLYPNIAEDGHIGVYETVPALRALLRRDWEAKPVLLSMLACQQGVHYMNLMSRDERQEAFARGWFRHRVLR